MRSDDENAPTELEGTPPTTVEHHSPNRVHPARVGDRYRVGDLLGRGGMGEVLDARDLQIGRDVAIKCLRQEAPSDRAVQRFLREAKIQGRLEHPSIVPVHELGRGPDGRPFFAMKKLAGTTLAKLLKADAPRQRLLRAFSDVCLAVEFAHTRGFVHRDLKPDNIMLGDFGETYVLDWGVAKVVGKDDDLDATDSEELATVAGTVMGTPGYMSPEQARGLADIDARTDVYALGCVLFEILAGQPLHPRGKEALVTVRADLEHYPSRRAPGRDIPPELDELVMRATRMNRADRIATARALADEVQRYLDGDRDLERRRELAREHVAVAKAALATDDHPTATREAGRALALDPMQRTAADVLSSILLVPPKIVPAQVQETLAAENLALVRRTARAGWFASFGYVLVAMLLLVASPVPADLALAMLVLAAINTALLFSLALSKRFTPRYSVFFSSVLLAALCCRVASPFLVGPGLAALTAVGILAGPFSSRRQVVIIFAGTLASVLVPWIGELAGWWSPTMFFVGTDLVIDAPFFSGGWLDEAWLVTITVLMVATAIAFTRGIRSSERAAREQLHLITWQLRHLVPR